MRVYLVVYNDHPLSIFSTKKKAINYTQRKRRKMKNILGNIKMEMRFKTYTMTLDEEGLK